MFKLDAPTLLITLTAIQWLLAGFLLVQNRKEPGINGWALSLFIHGFSNLFLFARPHLHPYLGIVFYNACVMVAFAFSHWALGQIFARDVPRWQLVLPVILSVVSMSSYLDDIGSRVVYASLIVSMQLGLMTQTIVSSTNIGGQRLKRWLIMVMGGFSVAYVGRATFAHFYPDLFTQLLGTSLLQAGLILSGIAYSVINTLIIFLYKLERVHEKLHREATRDSLTGLFNRRAFLARAKRRVDTAAFPISVLMIDLDDFKAINDSFGHSVGDKVLIHCAEVFEQVIDEKGTVGRLGGEEFAVVVPDCDSATAQQLSVELLHAVQRSSSVLEMTLSASIGVTTTSEALDIDSLLAQADDALYCAKHEGKNTFKVYTSKFYSLTKVGCEPA
ncbi:GGDEF domain-containing protein [Salinivibrio sp. ES.052]|uniref:GGDEF domain-containing protein n=1 Tax=Salinivibrio sp. ES.052 TaxID=1882823 RepID=UPI00092BE9C6|nr:GGDEF domain-containing protein [Salinivibrio sp. ES.052]SIO33511.1 diguanylate cyclase (GGDEF) domain-containing protein [Salinivibrio sp. ES.052]